MTQEISTGINERRQEEMSIRPIGYVKSELKDPSLNASSKGIDLAEGFTEAKKQAERIKSLTCEIHINDEYEGIADGIEDFSHILVLYWPHLTPPESRTLKKVHPVGRRDYPLVGVFATCSPARPNPILVTTVRLVGRRKNTLVVQGLEAVDGSPVVDIKPYVKSYYSAEDVQTPEWMTRIHQELAH